MIFQDNIIKEYLRNVYFITGTPCGGKTTISRLLGEKHGIEVYDIDRHFEEHRRISDPVFQPSMNKTFRDADEFFSRSVEEYKAWLLSNTREQLDFVLLDLIRLSQDKPVICDCYLTLEQAQCISDVSRVAFLVKNPENLVDDYCNRPDHQDFSNYIHSCTDFEKAKAVCNRTLYELNIGNLNDIKSSRFFWIERTESSTAEDTLRRVEEHFGM